MSKPRELWWGYVKNVVRTYPELEQELKELRPDAILIADPGVFAIEREICPEIPVHISTQANNTNYLSFLFWMEQGAKRVVSARELSLEEIRDIRDHIPDEMHGLAVLPQQPSHIFTGQLHERDIVLEQMIHGFIIP